jgi:lysozyme
MKRRHVLAAIAASATANFPPTANANDEFDEQRANFSRGHLFQRVITAKKLEPPSATTEPVPLPGSFHFPTNVICDDGTPRYNSFFGIDVSHYTPPDIDFSMLREQGISFVYLKATQGLHVKDGRFAEFCGRLKELRPDQQVLKGAYHFLSSQGDGVTQADTFCDFVEQYGDFGADDLPPVMDLEWDVVTAEGPDRWETLHAQEIVRMALAFLARVQTRTQKVPMIYTTVSWWNERKIPLALFDNFKAHPLWIADYSKSSRAIEHPTQFPESTSSLWQFAANARLARGCAGELDANIFRGSREEFKALFGVPLP